ncbi:methyltransferase domain-containing protein [Marinobacterium aestuariivivens]|uniref:Methyltransferase domain-containing protein n=1 Tax=Marinobacterium aestuariivivens TaxID=1698799 RepID=A0ABW2AAF3_9GAMM
MTALFRHIHRALQPGGVMVFSTLGPGSLQELKRAWQSVDDHQHVNDFIPVRELENAILGSGFATLELRRRRQVLHYPKLQRLTRELKGIGAHNLNDKRPSGLVSRAKLTRLISSYERYRNDNGLLPATYEVVYGVLRKSRLERN